MKTNRNTRKMLLVAIVALVGFSGMALANPFGSGARLANQDCPRYQDDPSTDGPEANLSDEQIEALETLRSEFRAATADLRGELRQKALALRAELAKAEPDSAKAMALQTEISALNADLDAKRLAHRLEVHKIAPEAGYGCGGMGPRHGKGGHGPRWN